MENPQIGDVVLLNSTAVIKKPSMTITWINGATVTCNWYSSTEDIFKEKSFNKEALILKIKREDVKIE